MNYCSKCKRDLPEGEKCPVCTQKKGVFIEMEMPKSCSDCKYKEGAYTDERYTCKLLNITFPAEYINRFALCPLQQVKE